jgi:hypothetical protein
MATKKTVPVSKRALIARLNRKLAADEEVIKTTRENTRARQDLGEFYVVNFNRNAIVGSEIDLEEFGRKHKVLVEHEHLSDE